MRRGLLSILVSGWILVPSRLPAAESPLVPEPQFFQKLGGRASVVNPMISPWPPADAGTKAWADSFQAQLPQGGLPPEGYLLEVGAQGARICAADEAGERWALQTLAQLSGGKKKAPRVRIADWPDFPLRGFHVIPYTPAALPGMKSLVRDFLVPLRCNFFVFEIDYAFEFQAHPEVREKTYFTKEQIRDFTAYCRNYGIKVIPEVNCLGHQSWKAEGIGGLLKSHPELEEIPDGKLPQTDLKSDKFYCRSWCPLHPGLKPVVFSLMDELLDAFQSDGFHAGMDEVFLIGSSLCPRCKGRKPADLYARAVTDLHDHLKARGAQMYMWGDRLLNSAEMKESEWQASANGTDQAAAVIPKDIIMADWHYDYRQDYPSLGALSRAGFRVLPTTYANAAGAARFVDASYARKDPTILGPLATVWFSALDAAASAFPRDESLRNFDPETGARLPAGQLRPLSEGGAAIMDTVRVTLSQAWKHGSNVIRRFPAYAVKGPSRIPGRIQMEDYDEGGPDKGYHDADDQNEGGAYREGGVDISAVKKGGKEFSVGWVEDGEWTAYSVKVAKARAYDVVFHVAAEGQGGTIQLELDGKNLGPSMDVPDTGGWRKWSDLTLKALPLPSGPHRLRVMALKGPYNLDYLEFRPAP